MGAPDQDELRSALIATMRHPLRSRLLYTVADRPGSSATLLAARIGEPIGKVRRHLRQLLEAGLIGVSGREEKRGAMQSFYVAQRLPLLRQEDLGPADGRALRDISVGILRMVVSDLKEAVPWDARRPEDCISRLGGFVDEQGWDELATIFRDASGAVQEAKARAEERLANGTEEPIPFASAALFYEVES